MQPATFCRVFDGTDLVSVGNVTIPPNKEIPKPGDVVETRYLYAHREALNNSLLLTGAKFGYFSEGIG